MSNIKNIDKFGNSNSISDSSNTPIRSGPSYEETIVHGKKRKVWRSNHAPSNNNNNMMMSPEAAATYLQQAAEAAAAAAAAAGNGGESFQITLGTNGITATSSSATAAASSDGGGGGDGVGNKNLDALRWVNECAARGESEMVFEVPKSVTNSINNDSLFGSKGANVNMSVNVNSNSVSFENMDLSFLAKAEELSALTNAALISSKGKSPPNATFPQSMGLTVTKGSPLDTSGSFGFPSPHFDALPRKVTSTAVGKAGAAGAAAGSKDSLPCSEAEMKALMSMFVEIMGMSMNTEKLGKSTAAKRRAAKARKEGESKSSESNPFAFDEEKDDIWSDPAIAAATGNLDALSAFRYSSSDEEEEKGSLPDLDDMKEMQEQQQNSGEAASNQKTKPPVRSLASILPINNNPAQITGRSGIAPVEWESLEQIAIEDAMEAEERARKAAKRREKKIKKKEKVRQEAAAQAAEEAAKKREKTMLSWRAKIVSAVQSNEVEVLESLLEESPPIVVTAPDVEVSGDADAMAMTMTMDAIAPHLEFLLPQIVAKNRKDAERGNAAKTKLAHYLMSTNLPLVLTTPLRTGRTALHTACLYGEVDFLRQALSLAQTWNEEEEFPELPSNYLELTCQESGFGPIHYAVLSGVRPVLEVLLEAGAEVKLKSTHTHTWKSSTGKGALARELAETMSHGSQDKVLETHGLAIQEAIQHYSSSNDEKKKFKATLARMKDRLKDVEQNGYSPPAPEPEIMIEQLKVTNKNPTPKNTANDTEEKEDEDSEEADVLLIGPSPENSTNKANKKKKKKKKGNEQADSVTKQSSTADQDKFGNATNEKVNCHDPLVVALMGMGFAEDQINAAVKACGGIDRATADDCVMWLLSEASGETPSSPEVSPGPDPAPVQAPQLTNAAFSKPPQSPTPAPPPPPMQQHRSTSESKRDPSSYVVAACTKEAEVASKQADEARLKEQRLAAKREEKIRRNREWNEKAQTRQKEKEKAKIAEAVAEANRVAAEKAAREAVIQQQQHLQQQAQRHHVRQQQIHARHQQQQHAQQLNPMMVQQASNYFPGGSPAGMIPRPHPGHGHPIMGMGMPHPPPGHFGIPMGHAGYGPGRHAPPGNSVNMLDAGSRMTETLSRAQPCDGSYKHHSHLPPQPPPGMQKMCSPQGWEPPVYNSDPSSQYPVIPDDSTVSSYGSGRVSIPSNFSSALPPGFRLTPTTPSTRPPPVEEAASVTSYEENHLGEMRATAREFVPTFSSRPSSRATSTTSAPVPATATISEPAKTSRLPSLAVADRQSELAASTVVSRSLNFGSSVLSQGPGPNHLPTLMGASAEHFSPVEPAAAPSVTGISAALDDAPSLNVGRVNSSKVGSDATAPSLDAFTVGLSASSFEDAPAISGSSLWGGIGSGSPAVGAANGLVGLSLAGFSSLSLADTTGSATGSDALAGGESLLGESLLPSGLAGTGTGTWGSGNLGGSIDGTKGGSIW